MLRIALSLTLVLGLALPTRAGEAPVPADPALPRDYVVTFKTTVPPAPEGARKVEVWVPVPYQVPGVQEVLSLVVEAPGTFELRTEPSTGNRMIHAALPAGPEAARIVWTATVRRWFESGQEVAVDPQRHLEGDLLAPIDAAARAQAKALGAADASQPVQQRARAIYDHVVDETEYDKNEPGWGTGDFARVCRVGKGNCSDFTSRFVTLARAAGIPARWVSTIALSDDHAGCDACGYHCYAHFLSAGRWIPVDPSDARRIRDKSQEKAEWYFGHAERANIILSVGRDLTLVPPQRGEPVNFLWGPYVEVDGKPVALAPENRTYEYAAR